MLESPQVVFLDPQETPREVYPFRRVWRAVALEIGAMLGMVLLVFVGVLLGVLRDVPSTNWGLLLILVPLAVYLWVSVRGEQRAPQPREGLLTVTLFSALLANGVGVPLVEDIFQPRLWLSEAGFFSRVIGYACTVGITSEFLKFIAIRYTVFPRYVRVRIDGVAYSVAASTGYATVLNAQLIFSERPTVVADAISIATTLVSQVGVGVIVGYFLGDLAVRPNRPPFFLAGGLFTGAFVSGLVVGFRAIASRSGFAVSVINGLLVVVGFSVAVMLVINFLIETAENREANQQGRKRVR